MPRLSTRIQDEKKDVRNMISTQVTSYFFYWGRRFWETFQQPEVSFPCGARLHKISCQLILQLLRYVSAEQRGGLTHRHSLPQSCWHGREQT